MCSRETTFLRRPRGREGAAAWAPGHPEFAEEDGGTLGHRLRITG